MDRGRALRLLHWPLAAAFSISTLVWVALALDDYAINIPYAWGRTCIPCYNYVYFIYNDAYAIAYPGLIAAASFVVSMLCLLLIWTPRAGLSRALVRVFLEVAPACVLAFETGVYFLIRYWWDFKAANFLAGTPFTNQGVFWTAMVVLAFGLLLDRAMNARARAPAPALEGASRARLLPASSYRR